MHYGFIGLGHLGGQWKFGVPLDLAAKTMQTFLGAREAYGGAAWSTMVVKLLEDALKTDLRTPAGAVRAWLFRFIKDYLHLRHAKTPSLSGVT